MKAIIVTLVLATTACMAEQTMKPTSVYQVTVEIAEAMTNRFVGMTSETLALDDFIKGPNDLAPTLVKIQTILADQGEVIAAKYAVGLEKPVVIPSPSCPAATIATTNQPAGSTFEYRNFGSTGTVILSDGVPLTICQGPNNTVTLTVKRILPKSEEQK